MDVFGLVKILHIVSAAVLLGSGSAIAFFMLCALKSRSLGERYFGARITVLADYCFTLPAVIIQPTSGLWLAHLGGYSLGEPWLLLAYGLYALTILCWLPVVWIQIKLKHLTRTALETQTPLPSQYHTLARLWFVLGWPAFFALLGILYLMTVKPV